MNKFILNKIKKLFKRKLVAVSGGYDPIHFGHIRMIKEASKLGDVVIILNNNDWLMAKKGYVFMPENERAEIVELLKGVISVSVTKHLPNPTDMSVCEALERIKPDIFLNGGDRTEENIPEYETCKKLGIEMKFNVGEGGKVQSSSELIKKAIKTLNDNKFNS